MSFAARYPGYCGICRLKIRKGDHVVATGREVTLQKRTPINPIHATEVRSHYTKTVVCRYAHAQCAGEEEWSDA